MEQNQKRGLSRKARNRELRRALALAEAAILAEEAAKIAQNAYAWDVSQKEQELREELLWNPEHPGHYQFWSLIIAATETSLLQMLEAEQADKSAYLQYHSQLERMRSMGKKASKDADSVDFSYRKRVFRITSSYL
jgi:hypothetical protein